MIWLALLIAVAIIGGIITGLGGPGGVALATVLYSGTALTPSTIAGTLSTISVVAIIFASLLYMRSGDVDWHIVATLLVVTPPGTWLGVTANPYLSDRLFGLLLGVVTFVIGVTLLYRTRYGLAPVYQITPNAWFGRAVIAVIGFTVAVSGGVLGIGGAAISIPALILFGINPLTAIGSCLIQAILITTTTSAQYIVQGTVAYELVAVLGIPYVLAQYGGWHVAHVVEEPRIKTIIAILLLVMSAHLFLG